MSTKVVVGVLVVVILALVVCGGAGALWYFKTHQQVADVGPLAGQALVLPADTALLGGFDAKGFFASPGYKQIASGTGLSTGPDAAAAAQEKKDLQAKLEKGLAEAESKTGVRLDRDVDRVVIAMSNVAAPTPDGVMIAIGRFDKAKITSAVLASVKAEGKTATEKTIAGTSVLEIADPGKPSAILAVPSEGLLLAGTEGAVSAVLTARSASKRPLETNASMMALVKGLDAGSGYWLIADEPLVARGQKEAGPGAASMFPMPKTLTLAGKFEGSLMLAADMADEAAAKQASGMIDGGLAMVKMQAAQNPQVEKVPGAKEMVESLAVKAEGRKVSLSMKSPANGGSAMAGLIAALAAPALSGMGGGPSAMPGAAPEGMMPEGGAPAMTAEATPSPEEQAPATSEEPAAAPKPTPRPRPKATPRPAPPTTHPPATVAPAPTIPSGPVRIGGDIREPRKIKNVNPVYPELAKRARQQGIVILECTISAEGRVSDAKVLRGPGGLLDQAALDAVKQWVYEPTQLNGTPVPVVMTVTVNFKLN